MFELVALERTGLFEADPDQLGYQRPLASEKHSTVTAFREEVVIGSAVYPELEAAATPSLVLLPLPRQFD
ncbi:MAG: hypothetical protein M3O70_06550 [Actinomycetota bacterium]|nr:hypothetical protein [Actinomycetota bacterium]